MFARLALSLLFSTGLLASVQQAQAQSCSRNATVVVNDTCDAISNRYAVSTFQLALVNPVINSNCTNLQIGQDLCLGWTGADCSKVYVVVTGDTCDGISSKYGLGTGVLYANNPQIDSVDCSNIYTGEVLCVDTVTYSYSIAYSSTTNASSSVAVPTAVPTATATYSNTTLNNAIAVSGGTTVVTSTTTTLSTTSAQTATSSTATTEDDIEEEEEEDCDDDGDDDEDFCSDDDEDCDADDDEDLPYCDDV